MAATKYTPAEIIARYMCLANEGKIIGYWHPRAQERWRDFMPEAEKAIRVMNRAGYRITRKEK